WDFAVLDTSQFVILLPEIGFEDFDRAQESENGLIPLIKIAACRRRHVLCEDLLWYAIRQECGTNSPYGRHANSLLQKVTAARTTCSRNHPSPLLLLHFAISPELLSQ